MYFPKEFDRNLSIELSELIQNAYEQFDAFKKEEEWKLPDRYELIDEFRYSAKSDSMLGWKTSFYDYSIKKISEFLHKESILVPIGFIAKRKKDVFIVFRGTQTPKEWIDNFSIHLKELFIPSFGSIHEGFLHVYDSIKETIRKNVEGLDKGIRLYVTGHSLGAAMATIALADIEMNLKRKVSGLYTFGSPRVGDNLFAQAFNCAFKDRSFRICNTSDIVTSIPLPVPIIGSFGGFFSHVDTPVDFTIQVNDIARNHDISTYISELKSYEAPKVSLLDIFK